jgi:hypothetical protein
MINFLKKFERLKGIIDKQIIILKNHYFSNINLNEILNNVFILSIIKFLIISEFIK